MQRDYPALMAFISSRVRTPFAWGSNDCVTFAAAAVEAMTGREIAAGIGATWSSERGAVRVLKRRGGMAAAVSSVLDSTTPGLAQRGDVAGWLDAKGRLQLAIVEGQTIAGPGPSGLARLPRSAMMRAWSAT